MLTIGRIGTIGASVLAARAHPGVPDATRHTQPLKFLPSTTPRPARSTMLTRNWSGPAGDAHRLPSAGTTFTILCTFVTAPRLEESPINRDEAVEYARRWTEAWNRRDLE